MDFSLRGKRILIKDTPLRYGGEEAEIVGVDGYKYFVVLINNLDKPVIVLMPNQIEKNSVRIRINEITRWEEDFSLIHGDASRVGYRAVESRLEEERVQKIDEGKAECLPFVHLAKNIEDALDKYNNTHCKHDYLKAVECDWEEA